MAIHRAGTGQHVHAQQTSDADVCRTHLAMTAGGPWHSRRASHHDAANTNNSNAGSYLTACALEDCCACVNVCVCDRLPLQTADGFARTPESPSFA